jgi:hypothetical protein
MGEPSAANQAGDCTANAPDPGKLALAITATINETTCDAARRQWQFVAGALAFEPKFPAGPAPFRAVWEDSTPASSELGQQMSQLVTERAVNLV